MTRSQLGPRVVLAVVLAQALVLLIVGSDLTLAERAILAAAASVAVLIALPARAFVAAAPVWEGDLVDDIELISKVTTELPAIAASDDHVLLTWDDPAMPTLTYTRKGERWESSDSQLDLETWAVLDETRSAVDPVGDWRDWVAQLRHDTQLG